MADRRTVAASAYRRPSSTTWGAKAVAAARVAVCRCGRPWRARTWTAPAAAVERERTRQVAGIGCNLNQTARWANTHGSAAEAVAP